jgi:hypothetical protein
MSWKRFNFVVWWSSIEKNYRNWFSQIDDTVENSLEKVVIINLGLLLSNWWLPLIYFIGIHFQKDKQQNSKPPESDPP